MSSNHAVIVAVVTLKKEKLLSGGAPVFIVQTADELQSVATTLEKVLDASTHEIDGETLILVAH